MAAEPFRLFLFGTPYAELDNEPVRIAERKSLALVAYLALEGKQTREALTALLWPDLDRKRARANLRYSLWSIRKTLCGNILVVDGETVSLTSDAWVDVTEFYAALSNRAKWEDAVRLSRGDFLQGFTLADSAAFDDWQLFHTEALRRNLDRILARLVTEYTGRKEYERAIEHVRRRLILDPINEEAHRALMELYARTGQRSAAIHQYETCAVLLDRELHAEPEQATTQLYHEIRSGRFSAEPSDREVGDGVDPQRQQASYRLPDPPQILVGREAVFTLLAEKLADPAVRLLTLIGPGGAGKSSIAFQAARLYADQYRDGAAVTLLSETVTAAEAPSTILRDLGQTCTAEPTPQAQLTAFLADKDLLLILDNYEHLLPRIDLIREILGKCPQVTLLITSRERLAMVDEVLLPVGGLTCSAGEPTATSCRIPLEVSDAERLFLIAARRLQPGFRLDEKTQIDVSRICQMVDGLPLALEMAAAWVRVLPVATIAQELARSEHLLVNPSNDAAARHHSMEAVFQHSWELLSRRERVHLCRLAVFRGGFTGKAATAVADIAIFDLLRLIDSSWVRLANSDRYTMHRLARQYIERKAEQDYFQIAGEPYDGVRSRHARYFALLPVRAQAWQRSPISSPISDVVATELDNFLSAFRFAVESGDWACVNDLAGAHRVAAFIWWSAEIEAQMDSAISALRHLLRSDDDGEDIEVAAAALALAKVLCTEAEMLNFVGESRHAVELLKESRAVLQKHLSSTGEFEPLFIYVTIALGYSQYYLGDYCGARHYLEEALAGVAAAGGDGNQMMIRSAIHARVILTLVLDRIGEYRQAQRMLHEADEFAPYLTDEDRFIGQQILARILANQGNFDEAWRILVESLPHSLSRWRAHGLIVMGSVARCRGRETQACELLQEGLEIARTTNDEPAVADCLAELGATYLKMNKPDCARDHYAQSLQVAQRINRARTVALAETGLGRIAVAAGVPDQARDYFSSAVASTRNMGALPDVMQALLGIAELNLAQGKVEQTRRVLHLVNTHSATAHETREQAHALLGAIEPATPISDWESTSHIQAESTDA